MLDRKITALLLVAALVLGGASVLAADPVAVPQAPDQASLPAAPQGEDQSGQRSVDPVGDPVAQQSVDPATDGASAPSQPTDAQEEQIPDEPPSQVQPDPVGTISFDNLSDRMRKNNLNLLALDETIASVEVIDYDKMKENLRKTLNSIASAQWGMRAITLPSTGDPAQDAVNGALAAMATSSASQSLSQSYASLENTFKDLKDGKIQQDNQAVIRQLRNAQDQVVMAGESLYVALASLEIQDESLGRSLTALDRTVEEMQLRYDLGQISALTLQEVKAGRTALTSGQQTVEMNINSYKTQLELLAGAELTGKVRLQPLPQVSKQQLEAMNLDTDLAAAKEKSYTLFAAQRTLDDAKQAFKDAGYEYGAESTRFEMTSARHTWQGAQYTYNAAVQSFELSFRTLYLQVKDYAQIYQAAQTALAMEQASYAATQLKHEQGTIAKNKLLDAADQVSAAQEKVDSAAINLFSAYHNYRWANEYGILN